MAIKAAKKVRYYHLETSGGIGQSDTEMDHSDVSLYVMTPEFGQPN
jgi:putative protein kinase ArgK-like GTPase of G3E family